MKTRYEIEINKNYNKTKRIDEHKNGISKCSSILLNKGSITLQRQ